MGSSQGKFDEDSMKEFEVRFENNVKITKSVVLHTLQATTSLNRYEIYQYV